MKLCLDCKKPKSRKGNYCKSCGYKHRIRPKGLVYKIVKKNPTWFKKGFNPWNKDKIGVMPIPWNYKGNDVGYDALHDWVRKYKGKAKKCSKCNSIRTVQWANKSHKYKRDLDDWLELCRKCHMKYDKSTWGLATKKFNL